MDAFVKAVTEMENKASRDVMTQLCQLYACYGLSLKSSIFIEVGYYLCKFNCIKLHKIAIHLKYSFIFIFTRRVT